MSLRQPLSTTDERLNHIREHPEMVGQARRSGWQKVKKGNEVYVPANQGRLVPWPGGQRRIIDYADRRYRRTPSCAHLAAQRVTENRNRLKTLERFERLERTDLVMHECVRPQ